MMSEVMFGRQLEATLNDKKWSKGDLARKLAAMGGPTVEQWRKAIGNWCGKRASVPDSATLAVLAGLLEVSVDFLLGIALAAEVRERTEYISSVGLSESITETLMGNFDPNRLAKWRRLRGLTEGQLGIEAGLSEATIIALESGSATNPGVGLLMRAASALGIQVGDLLNVWEARIANSTDTPLTRADLAAELDARLSPLVGAISALTERLEFALLATDRPAVPPAETTPPPKHGEPELPAKPRMDRAKRRALLEEASRRQSTGRRSEGRDHAEETEGAGA